MTKFKKGQSGNPAGRPKGIPNQATRLRQKIADHVPEIIETLVANAKDGDTAAANVLLSRCLPALKPQADTGGLVLNGESLTDRAESISAAAMAGALSPTTAGELMGMLSQQARIAEVGELAERLERIEKSLGVQKP